MRRGALGLTTAALSSVLVVSGLEAAPASAATTTYTMPATGKVTLAGHGYGHGHGMSQYGAQGAATGNWGTRGKTPLTWQQILDFYYPGTKQVTESSRIRVRLSAAPATLVVAATKGLLLRDKAARTSTTLPTNGATNWRLGVASGTSVVDYKKDGVWTRWRTLAGAGSFFAGGAPVSLIYNGTAHRYRGYLEAAIPSPGSTTRVVVNDIAMDNYVRGVVTREMPSGWAPDALAAQAVAARTYGAFMRANEGKGYYDICDTTSCQVYGGYDAEVASGVAAVTATKGTILTWNGSPAFTQFSASSGGWTAAGSTTTPYLSARQDPYDDVRYADSTSANSSYAWQVSLDVAQIEKAFGFGNLTSITVTGRDGNGDWGGRVNTMTLTGTAADAKKSPKTVKTYGDTFRGALGLKSRWFTFTGVPTKTA